ncbi:carboxypeptidase-like regulatory domain-containing protein [Pararcticibacter amylolyticus]|uniref:Carboxypeptidase regulatory-like domain-containing protein n=1 Tax=Pararcticibacter amylolyticus TaxID=2173175 RepID=A0A2U2PBS0_9SPHI|nr:carboxypeptidase-like regulatory domain-containing protein [Pararcticibacter amylolyticus]PWG78569.1 hypothetical protein DDR33_21645 [Pararcticibacter amylolyticus]
MNTNKFLTSLFAFIFTISFSVFSQPDTISINSIVEKAQAITEGRPLEKVHVHFDKPYYAVGDTIWFKTYLTSNLHLPSQLSKVVYVDISNSRDSIIETLRLPVRNSVASGSLTLSPMNFRQGSYQFRAYTRWMLNFADAYFFTKTINIGNTMNKELTTHISLQGEPADKGYKVNAKVLFKDETGKPYVNKKVNWRIIAGLETLSKGRGTTDQSGYLVVNAVLASIPVKTPQLETVISVSDQKDLTSTFSVQPAFSKPDMQFFPEGGRLISGVSSNIAFKAIRANGMGIEASGTVTDNSGTTVAKFNSRHLGMGMLNFTPDAEKTYKANVTFADGSKASYDLPKPRTSGIGLAVNAMAPDNIAVRIAATPAYLERHQDEPFYIIARSGGVTCYAAQTRLQSAVHNAAIPKDKFPSGVVEITLFTATGSPVAERLVFITHPNTPGITMNSDKPAYTTRQKVKLGITAKYTGQPLEGSYSVAVVDESKVPYDEDSETSIMSSLLLSSDLKGYVEKPNYYFHQMDEKKIADLDVLMLTQGYRSYSYRDILDDKVPAVSYLPEQGIEISGTLRMKNGLPVNKGVVQFIVPEKGVSASAQTNAEGKFRFTNLVFPDSSKAILSARGNVNSRNMMIMVDGDVLPGATPNVNQGDVMINIDSTLNPYLANSKKVYRTAVVLQEVVIKSRATPKPSHKDYPALSGLSAMPDQLIPGDRFQSCPFLLDCLKGGTMGMMFSEENFYITRDYNSGNRTPVQVFLNGMPVDAINLSSVNSSEVESVEIFLRDDLGTVNRLYNTNGVLVVNTKKPPKGTPVKLSDLQELLPQSNLINFTPMGYQKARQFYSPKYAVVRSGPVTNDLRSTIYWNPSVVTDAEGKASVEFFNADGRGPYRAVVEGMDKDGNMMRTIYRYTVK